MIKLRFRDSDGQPTLALLGLTRENIDRLVAGKPIRFDLAELGLPACQFAIVYGETERDVLVPFAERGIVPWTMIPPADQPEPEMTTTTTVKVHYLARKPADGGGGHTPGVGWMCTGCDWRFSYDVPEERAREVWRSDDRHTAEGE